MNRQFHSGTKAHTKTWVRIPILAALCVLAEIREALNMSSEDYNQCTLPQQGGYDWRKKGESKFCKKYAQCAAWETHYMKDTKHVRS